MKRANRVLICSLISLVFLLGSALASAGVTKRERPAASERSGVLWKSDPFKPFLEIDAQVARAGEKLRAMPLSPLLNSPIERFRLTGIGGVHSSRMAVVEDGKGRFYILLPGSHIGTRNGRVVQIHPDHVIIEERMKTSSGEEKREEIKLNLHIGGQEGRP